MHDKGLSAGLPAMDRGLPHLQMRTRLLVMVSISLWRGSLRDYGALSVVIVSASHFIGCPAVYSSSWGPAAVVEWAAVSERTVGVVKVREGHEGETLD